MAKKKKNERPACPFNRADCFAWMKGNKCYCLDNTAFKEGRNCPFYKKHGDVDQATIAAKHKEEKLL